MTFQTSRSHSLRRSYTPDEFKLRPARIAGTTQSHEAIAASLVEVTLLTQHRPLDRKFESTMELVDTKELFGRACGSETYRLFLSRLPAHETSSYIAVSENRMDCSCLYVIPCPHGQTRETVPAYPDASI